MAVSPAQLLWPPFIGFGIREPEDAGSPNELVITVDLCEPQGTQPKRVRLRIGSKDQIKVYPDGAQLFRCVIEHDADLAPKRSGFARQVGDDFEVRVFHHTAQSTVPLIRKSGHFLGSPWNLQGTRKLTNVCYPYFTTLPRIRSEADLNRIAMAHTGVLTLRGMADPIDPVVDLAVYRSSTLDRNATIAVWLPVGVMSPNHLLHFMPVDDQAYYEVILPEVVRVGLNPGCRLAFDGNRVTPNPADLRTFDYVICGDASKPDGLEAPYDEENTTQVLHLENLQSENIFEFWERNMNSDQVTGRNPDARLLGPR